MKATHTIIALCGILALASCEKVVEFNIDDTEPRVVVMAQGESDSLLSVRLTYSRFFLDANDFKVIDNATVSMVSNGTQWPAAVYQNDMYRFGQAAHCGDTLQLTVAVPGKQDITAACRVPFPPQASLTSVNEHVDGNGNNVVLHIRLNDPPDERNYYRITLLSKYYWIDNYDNPNSTDTVFVATEHHFECSDYAIIDQTDLTNIIDGENTFNGSQLSFSDDRINGQSHDIILKFDHYYGDMNQYIIVMESLPRDLYLYERSITQSRNDMEFLSEPTQIHCNVTKGAIGIFGIKARLDLPFEVTPPQSEY